MITYDYSLIKYMPSLKRGEIVNIGLIVFNKSGIDTRMLSGAAKLRLLDGSSTIDDITEFEYVLEQAKGLYNKQEDIVNFLGMFKNAFKLSPKATFAIDHAGQYESQVARLFNDLVKPFSVRESVKKSSRIQTLLKHKFESMNLLAKSADELSYHKVVQNYNFSDKSGFTADFLLKNGKFHISEVIDYNVNDLSAKFKETTLKVMTFMEGKKHLGQDSGCYFVYSASSEREKEIQSHLNLAEDYSSSIFNIASKQEEKTYLNLISRLAGVDAPIFH
ncbi:DUF3037 domain-containing protein [Pseudomonas savastanoi pv. phaseolicola]|nr:MULTISPECIES: DUF3037 domain-containing protein [Pseudomonas]MBN4182444.1 hypothetical protein [Pseudomonas savastanoi pv. phaseolicola]MDG6380681.1 DUF3037 domain-containing protein [Pseudomonas savastanoi pv. phaseolicola]MDG6391041.1 DUF3037 domain-containing protein [Pseudomonas savastanoi pv. phaseolicola]ODS47660.1 MAG: hypothetical protein BEH78_12665 [Pseudomonas sp. BDAL1]QDW00405.1 DUF3037 domain-containing protein [Pseudomonas sp. KBS0707]